MRTDWIPTNEYYRRILAEPDETSRLRLYLDLFVHPWKPMMDMLTGMFPGRDPTDELAGARAWNWLLPNQVHQIDALLSRLEETNAWQRGAQALAEAAARFDPYAGRIPFDAITGWLVLGDPANSNSFEPGYTGAVDWTQPRFIGQFWDLNEYNLPRLPGLVAHEMHHLIRLQAFPWDMHSTTVADYIVVEGTAEAFAASLYGAGSVGYYITEFNPQDFETARRIIAAGLDRTGFDLIRSYIFGDELARRWGAQGGLGMPTYGGYTIGYLVVQAFLERTGCSIEEATFLPAGEIVERSGFFQD